jgi:hypothetical protein
MKSDLSQPSPSPYPPAAADSRHPVAAISNRATNAFLFAGLLLDDDLLRGLPRVAPPSSDISLDSSDSPTPTAAAFKIHSGNLCVLRLRPTRF